MSADPLDGRLRAALHDALDARSGPHPTWSRSPAATRVAAGPDDRRARLPRWRWLAAVAALAVVGGAVLVLSGRPEPVGARCPTVDDHTAASAAPTPEHGRAPSVAFPSVGPEASATTGLQPPGAWVVVADEAGPSYQMRVDQVRACDRLPTVRPADPGGSLLLAQFDVRFLRSTGNDPWIGPDERLVVEFGSSTPNQRPLDQPFDVPGVVRHTSLSPHAGFAVSTLLVVDVPATDASVQLRLAPPDGDPLAGEPGWRIREGLSEYELPSLDPPVAGLPTPGATATVGGGQLGATTTIPVADGVLVARVDGVEEVLRYPGLEPPTGEQVIEARVLALGWSSGADPAVDWPDLVLDDLTWVLTDAAGTSRPSLGDIPNVQNRPGLLQGVVPQASSSGLLAFTVPVDGPLRMALQRDGVEIAWWSLRD